MEQPSRAWICSTCNRHVPSYVDRCRCGHPSPIGHEPQQSESIAVNVAPSADAASDHTKQIEDLATQVAVIVLLAPVGIAACFLFSWQVSFVAVLALNVLINARKLMKRLSPEDKSRVQAGVRRKIASVLFASVRFTMRVVICIVVAALAWLFLSLDSLEQIALILAGILIVLVYVAIRMTKAGSGSAPSQSS